MNRYLDCGCCIKDDGSRVWCPTCESGGSSYSPSAGSVPRFKLVCAMGQNWVQDTGDGNRMIAMCTRWQDAMTIINAMNRDAQNDEGQHHE